MCVRQEEPCRTHSLAFTAVVIFIRTSRQSPGVHCNVSDKRSPVGLTRWLLPLFYVIHTSRPSPGLHLYVSDKRSHVGLSFNSTNQHKRSTNDWDHFGEIWTLMGGLGDVTRVTNKHLKTEVDVSFNGTNQHKRSTNDWDHFGEIWTLMGGWVTSRV